MLAKPDGVTKLCQYTLPDDMSERENFIRALPRAWYWRIRPHTFVVPSRLLALALLLGASLHAAADEFDDLRLARDKARYLMWFKSDYPGARAVLEQEYALADQQASGDKKVALTIRETVLLQLGDMEAWGNNLELAEHAYLRAIALFDDGGETSDGLAVWVPLQQIEVVYLREKKNQELIATGRRLLEILETLPDSDWRKVKASVYVGLGLERTQKINEAQQEFERAITVIDQGHVTDLNLIKATYQEYILMLRRLKRNDEAFVVEARLNNAVQKAEARATQDASIDPNIPEPASRTGTYVKPAVVDLNQCKPSYPLSARSLGMEGMVVMRIDLDADGNPIASHVVTTSEWQTLDHATEMAMKQCKYRPATLDGKPISSSLKTAYYWKLDK